MTSKFEIRNLITSYAVRRRFKPSTRFQRCVLAIVMFVIPANVMQVDARAESTDSPRLVGILEPYFNNTYTQNEVPVKIHMSTDALPSTFVALLNGQNITQQFMVTSGCGVGQGCDKAAMLSGNSLVNGTNVITVDVEGPNQSVGTGRVQFEYHTSGGATFPVNHLVPGVAINTLYLPSSKPAGDPSSYEILIGPGPDFPQRVYTAANLSCSAGINSVQVLVLNRRNLDPDATVGAGTNHPGQECFGDADALKTFLGGLAAGKLVIANSFYGTMPNLNTTAIGGTDYSQSGSPLPRDYSIIGVMGASAGHAYESFQPFHQDRLYIPPLVGSLMLDNLQNYYFVPSEYGEFSVQPNDPSYPNTPTSSIYWVGQHFTKTLPPTSNGGFWILAIDRQRGFQQESGFYSTNDHDPAKSLEEVNRLVSELQNHYSKHFLLFLTTLGTPFSSGLVATDGLYDWINRLGGTGYVMPQLAGRQSDGRPQAYTLISSTDRSYPYNQVVEESSVWSTKLQTGTLDGVLSRNRKNLWSVSNATTETFSDGAFHVLSNYEWTEVSYQQMQNWPVWTPGEQAAYADLTAVSNHYPTIRTQLGCVGQICQPIRTYYSGGVGGGDSAALRIDYSGLSYYENADYTHADFAKVIAQLATEQGYLGNVYSIYGQFRDLTDNSQSTIQSQISSVADNLESGLVDRGRQTALIMDNAMRGATVATMLSIIPGIGPVIGGMMTVSFGVAAFAQPTDVLLTDYSVTLQQLIDRNSTFGLDLANSTDTLFLGIVSDWGKLQTIGGGYGARKAPWYMCPNCEGSNIPRAGIPALALGAKRNFYMQLLPTLYSLDRFYGKTTNDPKKMGGELRIEGVKVCLAPYQYAPADTFIVVPNITQETHYDFSFFVETQYQNTPYAKEIHYPPASLVDDLFNPPTIDNLGLKGGADLILERFTSGNLKPLHDRAGYLPGPACVD